MGGDHTYFAEAGQVLCGGVQHPLHAAERLAEARQIRAGDGVDEGGAGTLSAQLHQIGALSVAVTGRAFGVDGDGAAARGERGDHLGERVLVGDDGRNPVTGFEEGIGA